MCNLQSGTTWKGKREQFPHSVTIIALVKEGSGGHSYCCPGLVHYSSEASMCPLGVPNWKQAVQKYVAGLMPPTQGVPHKPVCRDTCLAAHLGCAAEQGYALSIAGHLELGGGAEWPENS